jgi:murein DD-endopeptidase MepM/ murein hydrolase activator NlpD
MLLGKIETMEKEVDLIDSHKLKEKLGTIDENLLRITSYLHERGVMDEKPGTVDGLPYGSYGVDVIEYYYELTGDVYNNLRNTPLGYPYNGEFSSGYGYRTNPFGGAGGEFHSGIDFKGDVGDIVTASADGWVKSADWYGGYGIAVVIQHKFGFSTIYGHLSATGVHAGQYVKTGDVIGYIGSTGRSTGPHLHYEIRKDGTDISPSRFLSIN